MQDPATQTLPGPLFIPPSFTTPTGTTSTHTLPSSTVPYFSEPIPTPPLTLAAFTTQAPTLPGGSKPAGAVCGLPGCVLKTNKKCLRLLCAGHCRLKGDCSVPAHVVTAGGSGTPSLQSNAATPMPTLPAVATNPIADPRYHSQMPAIFTARMAEQELTHAQRQALESARLDADRLVKHTVNVTAWPQVHLFLLSLQVFLSSHINTRITRSLSSARSSMVSSSPTLFSALMSYLPAASPPTLPPYYSTPSPNARGYMYKWGMLSRSRVPIILSL